MKIVSWNVNGIRALHRKGLFMSFIIKYKPDILCLQETKANATGMADLYSKTCRICQSSLSFPKNVLDVAKATPRKFFAPKQATLSNLQRLKSNSAIPVACQHQSEVDLKEYEEYWNSAVKKGYSGTAIFTKVKPLSVSFNIPEKIAKKYDLLSDGYGDPNTEGRLMVAEYGKFYVATVYTPNAKEDLSRVPLRHKQWDPAFLEYMKDLEKKKPVVFCGDLNVAHTEDDLANPKQNKGKHGFTHEEREGITNMVDEGFIDTFRMFTKGNGHYSWWSHFANARARNVGWRIDYIFVSDSLKNKVKKALIHQNVLGSDHCPVEIEIVL